MKKRNLILGLIASLIVIMGSWGVIKIRTLTPGGAASGDSIVHISPTDQTSLYMTGALVIPTVKVTTSTVHCNPKQIPGADSDPVYGIGTSAIKPHLCSIPTFTAQDVRQYMRKYPSFSSLRIRQISPNYIVTRILFVTNEVANDPHGLNADTGVIPPNLIVCYVEVYGTFRVDGGPPRPPGTTSFPEPVFHHGQMVFDGVTGNSLVIGVVP